MIGVISAFGIQEIQDELKNDIKKHDMFFLCDDCINSVGLIMEVEQHKQEANVIIINNMKIRNLDATLSEIREFTKTARIVLILNGLRKQYVQSQLNSYRENYWIEDIIFEGSGIDKFELLSCVGKGSLTIQKERYAEESYEEPSLNEEAPIEVNAKPSVIKKEKLRKEKVVNKPKKRKKQNYGCLSIAIFGTTHGAGATNMAATLAEFFALNGKKVLALNLSGGNEFQYISGQAEYHNVKSVDMSKIKGLYDIIIFDLGTPFNISSNGKFGGISVGYNHKNIELLKVSALKIVMALSDAWHIKKCEYFLSDEGWKKLVSNDYIFLLDTELPKVLKNKYPEINMFYRNNQSFADEIAELFL